MCLSLQSPAAALEQLSRDDSDVRELIGNPPLHDTGGAVRTLRTEGNEVPTKNPIGGQEWRILSLLLRV